MTTQFPNTDEEAIREGFLVVRRQGVMTQYLPTDKYRALFCEWAHEIVAEMRAGRSLRDALALASGEEP